MKKAQQLACILLVLLVVPAVYASTITRSFSPKKAMPGDTVTVTLALDEVAQELSYVVEESIPEGWAVSSGGGGEISGSKISWLLIEGLAPGVTVEDKTFTYTVVVPPSVSGTAVFNGTYRFESMGSSSSILGETQVNVGSAPPGSAAVPAPAPVAYNPPPASAPAPAPSAYAAPEPTPSPVAYTPPAPESAYEPEPSVPPVAEVYAPASDGYVPSAPVPDTSAPVRADQPSYEAAYEAPVPSAPYGSAPSAADSSPSSPPTDYPLPIADTVSPTPYVEPPTKTPWLWIVAGIIAVGGIIGGGIYLKQHLKEGVPAGGQHFSQQSVTYYIEQYSKLGYSKEQILSHLVKNGVPLDAVKQAISEYEKSHMPKAS